MTWATWVGVGVGLRGWQQVGRLSSRRWCWGGNGSWGSRGSGGRRGRRGQRWDGGRLGGGRWSEDGDDDGRLGDAGVVQAQIPTFVGSRAGVGVNQDKVVLVYRHLEADLAFELATFWNFAFKPVGYGTAGVYYRVVVAAAAPHQMEVGMADVDGVGAGKVKDAKSNHVVAIAGGRRGIVGEVMEEKWLRVLHDADDLHLQPVGAYEDISGRVGVVEGEAWWGRGRGWSRGWRRFRRGRLRLERRGGGGASAAAGDCDEGGEQQTGNEQNFQWAHRCISDTGWYCIKMVAWTNRSGDGCRNFACVYNSHKNIPTALNLSAREPSPMKASEFKDNRMNLPGIRAPQVHAEG